MKYTKDVLRQRVKEKIHNLPQAYCQAADRAIVQYSVTLPAYQRAKTIFVYVGRGDEINTLPLIEQALRDQKRVGVPLCIGKGLMEVRQIHSLTELHAGAYGIQEPKATAPLIAPDEIELAFIPCLTCNRQGKRLGYGGGFYDRYLEKTSCVRVVLGREQIMEPQIPVEAHDLTMDVVISEAGITYTDGQEDRSNEKELDRHDRTDKDCR